MKKLIYSLLTGVIAFCITSCMEIDNFDAPDAHLTCRLIDATTGENFITDHIDSDVRIWEMSYSTDPSPQDIPVKSDATYNNTKLFAGTYNVLPYNGPYWPADTAYNVQIGGGKVAVQDFTVTPYLKILEFKTDLVGDTLTMSCRLQAPLTGRAGIALPQVLEIRPFLSLTQYCGNANKIDFYGNDYRINLRRTWEQLDADGDGISDATYTIKVPVKEGYTYNVRMGANVNDTYQKFNYSEIVRIVVPD